MTRSSRRVLYWAPRLLAILFAAFISIFALDVFDHNEGFWQTTLALMMHLIPTWIVLAVLAISWRREWVAGLLFLGLAALYVVMFLGRFHWSVYVLISGPLVVMSALFLINWRLRAELRPGQGGPGI